MGRALLIALALAGAGAAQLAAVPAAPAQAQRDWTKTVVVTPEGGFRMGDPAAAVKLVEYGSLTCPHCAHFAKDAVPNLLGEVRRGKVSYELRNFVRDPADLAGALLSRCAPPTRYFALTDQIFASQEQWLGRLNAMSEAEQQEIAALTPPQRIARYASVSGLNALAAQAGVSGAQANACLIDQKAIDRLLEIRRVATERDGVQGTPTFLINGRKVDGVHDWATLQPNLAAK